MPQLDIVTFFNQAFWVFLFLLFFYLVVAYKLIPFVSRAVKVKVKKKKQATFFSNSVVAEVSATEVEYSVFFSESFAQLIALNSILKSNLSKTFNSKATQFSGILDQKLATGLFLVYCKKFLF